MNHTLNMNFKTALALLMIGPAVLMADDWKNALQESLRGKYELTKTGLDRIRITKPGTVLVIQASGVSGDLATDMTFLNNKVIDGKVAQAGGFAAAMQDKKTSRIFKPGEKAYVFKIDVKKNAVEYFLISCDTFDVNLKGSTRQTRYKSLLTFEFPEGSLEGATVETIKKTVDAVIVPEDEAKAASTKTVELGQTQDQVKAALGSPDKIVNLGAKTIFVYKDMKVVFQDGKVSDVQ
ncbi:MAG TPA: hypothetical protein VIX89_06510 [Bryobacteraceae bacterium]